MRTSAEIFWSDDDACWVAIDRLRAGCSAVGDTEAEALSELQDARKAWDGAKEAAATLGQKA